MKAVVQRVSEASVTVDGETVAAIGSGLLVYLGIGKDDDQRDVSWMAEKVAFLRIFHDQDDKMSLSVLDAGGSALVVSQFTLFGDVRKGRRPSFDGAAEPELALEMYQQVCEQLRQKGLTVETGKFRAKMLVRAAVDGPVTILVDSRGHF
jgi:D-tyrosyl-tRNA(Tyr) deacylase